MKFITALLFTFLVFTLLLFTFPVLVGRSEAVEDVSDLTSVDVFDLYHSFVDFCNGLGSVGRNIVDNFVTVSSGVLKFLFPYGFDSSPNDMWFALWRSLTGVNDTLVPFPSS